MYIGVMVIHRAMGVYRAMGIYNYYNTQGSKYAILKKELLSNIFLFFALFLSLSLSLSVSLSLSLSLPVSRSVSRFVSPSHSLPLPLSLSPFARLLLPETHWRVVLSILSLHPLEEFLLALVVESGMGQDEAREVYFPDLAIFWFKPVKLQ